VGFNLLECRLIKIAQASVDWIKLNKQTHMNGMPGDNNEYDWCERSLMSVTCAANCPGPGNGIK